MAFKVGQCLLLDRLNAIGMSQTELAERLGVKRQQVNKYARNKQTMSYEIAYNISVILGCSMEELYDWEVGAKTSR